MPDPTSLRITEKGWGMVMDLKLMSGRPLEEIAAESGVPMETLEFLKAAAEITMSQRDQSSD